MMWKEKALADMIGEKVELKTVEGFWIKPRLYSMRDNAVIQGFAVKLQKLAGAQVVKSITEKKIDDLSSEELAEVINDKIAGLSPEFLEVNVDRVKRILMSGVAETNLNEHGKINEKDAEGLLDYEPLALEIVKVVETFNRPLANPTSET